MPMAWTSEQILALAPDASSAKSGKDLASPRKWVSFGRDEKTAWGECQGSGKDPYQTRIELAEPAFKCSCPSRKFPCKHSLGLFLLLAEQPKLFKPGDAPPWVQEWLASRQQRAEKKAAKQEAVAAQGDDPEAQARRAAEQEKRAAKRQKNVLAGLDDLERWLRDCVRQGLATLNAQPYSFYEGPAARLVDAQAPGLARMVRDLAGVPSSGEGWQGRMLERLGLIHLLAEACRRLDALPAEVQADVRARVGWTVSQEDLSAQEGLRDRWMVLGQRVTEEEKLRVQRSWLWGCGTNRAALLLNFAAPGQALDVTLAAGTTLDAELVFYPSAFPLRALINTRYGEARGAEDAPGFESVAEAASAYAKALAAHPWLEEFPVLLRAARPEGGDGAWRVRDSSGAWMPLASPRGEGWRLLALSGGAPLSIFGEWNGERLLPLGARAEGRYVRTDA
ncbi:MAG: SWIM zinc finger family protein [Planctomycetes bacterium]|nr:SWIM zinc finger family protein [Planctomycetota bacterium]